MLVNRVAITPVQVYHQDPGWGWGSFLLPYLEQAPLYNQIDFQDSVAAPASQAIRTTVQPIYTCPADYGAGVVTMTGFHLQPVGKAATNSYAACYGALGLIDVQPDQGNGLMVMNSKFRDADVPDGLSNTLAVGERSAMLAHAPWAGVMSGVMVVTTPGAPVNLTQTEGAPCQVMARICNRNLLSPNAEPYDFFSPHRVVVQFVFADGSVHPLSTQVSIPVLMALATRAGGETIDAGDY